MKISKPVLWMAAGGEVLAFFIRVAVQTAESGIDRNTAEAVQIVNTSRQSQVTGQSESLISEVIRSVEIPNDPLAVEQWYLEKTGWSAVNSNLTGKVVTVAVLDTGIDKDHTDLSGKIAGSIDFTGNSDSGDTNGHGTHIAGIIAAQTNNGLGIAGIAPGAFLLNVKVADEYGLCKAENVAKGICWAVDNGADVINISLQISENSPLLLHAIDYAWEQGVLVVAAAGNKASTKPVYPAFFTNALAVGATGHEDELAMLSSYGDWVDVTAPGETILSTVPGNGYGMETGTSFAAAQVSGLAALLYSCTQDINDNNRINDEVVHYIEAGCRKLTTPGTGYGRIDFPASPEMVYR